MKYWMCDQVDIESKLYLPGMLLMRDLDWFSRFLIKVENFRFFRTKRCSYKRILLQKGVTA